MYIDVDDVVLYSFIFFSGEFGPLPVAPEEAARPSGPPHSQARACWQTDPVGVFACITFPSLRHHMQPYWKIEDEVEVQVLLRFVLNSTRHA